MHSEARLTAAGVALQIRRAGLAAAARGWGNVAHLGALAFVAVLYANPLNWWPELGALRLGVVTAAVCTGGVVARRLVGGERIRMGGLAGVLLLAYGAVGCLSLLWSIAPAATGPWAVELSKLMLFFVALQNALDSPPRVRRFMLVAALASLGPALGGIHYWMKGVALVEGVRTRWVGMFTDPNRLAMDLIAVLPFALCSFGLVRRTSAKLLLAGVVAAQLAAIVLTYSRTGAVATALALVLFLLRGGGRTTVRGVLVAGVLAAAVGALAPKNFWERESTIAEYQEDASLEGRRNAWKVVGSIVEERPLGGVGGGAFLLGWDRYAPLSAGGQRLIAHNLFLETLGELGVAGLVLFTLGLGGLLVPLWRAGRHPAVGREARAAFAGLAGYLVCAMMNGYTLSWFLYFQLALAAAVARLARRRLPAVAEEAP